MVHCPSGSALPDGLSGNQITELCLIAVHKSASAQGASPCIWFEYERRPGSDPGHSHPGHRHSSHRHPSHRHPGHSHPGHHHPRHSHPAHCHPRHSHPVSSHPRHSHPGHCHPGHSHPVSSHPSHSQPGLNPKPRCTPRPQSGRQCHLCCRTGDLRALDQAAACPVSSCCQPSRNGQSSVIHLRELGHGCLESIQLGSPVSDLQVGRRTKQR